MTDSKRKKYNMKGKWKSRGLNMDHFETIYQRYINSTNCEICNKPYKSTRDRCMDHCHKTGEFRNIVCQKCNNNKFDRKPSGKVNELYIYERHRTRKNKDGSIHEYKVYMVRIKRDGNIVFNKERMKLEDAIKIRDEYIKNN